MIRRNSSALRSIAAIMVGVLLGLAASPQGLGKSLLNGGAPDGTPSGRASSFSDLRRADNGTNVPAASTSTPYATALGGGTIISAGTGNWNAGGTWVGGVVPGALDNVIIADGDTVTLNANGSCNSLTVGEGVSGQLTIGSSPAGRTLTVSTDVVVSSGATVTVGANNATHSLNLGGDLINDGTLNLAPTAGRVCNVGFTKNGNQTISGAGATTRFNRITVNLGTTNANVLEVTATNFAVAVTNFLILTNGTFKLSAGAAVTPFTGNVTIPATGGLWVNHKDAIVSTTGGTVTFRGYVHATAGVLNIGNANNNSLSSNGGTIIIDGGTVNIAGRLDKSAAGALTDFTISSGTLTVATVSSTTGGAAPFRMDEVGSKFNMSGGTIIVRRSGAGNLGYTNTGGTLGTVSGGTLQIGNASTPAGQTIQINASIPVPNLVISNGAAVTAQLATNSLTVQNGVTINSGTLNANALNIAVGGDWTHVGGTFTPSTGTVTFNGTTAQAIGGAVATTFNNVAISNVSAAVSANTSFTTSGTLTVNASAMLSPAAAVVVGGTGTLTGNGTVQVTRTAATADFNSQYTITNKTLTNLTVEYAGLGQVLSNRTYGGLTISGSITGAANTGSVGGAFTVTGIFAPTSGTITMNNGSSIANTGGTLTFNDLAIANSASVTESGACTVNGTLTLGTGSTFAPSGTVTANGNISNAGIQTGTGTIALSGGASTHVLSGGGSYTNVQLDDSQGSTVSSNTTVNGLLTLTNGVLSMGANTLTIGPGGDAVQTAGFVVGPIRRYVPAGASSHLYPVGIGTFNVPVRLQFSSVTTPGYVTLIRTGGEHPNAGATSNQQDTTHNVNVWWRLTNSGVVLGGPYTATFAFKNPAELNVGVVPTASDFGAESWNGVLWQKETIGQLWADSTRVDGLSAFGDYALGKLVAALISATQSGLWNDPATWGGARVPGANDTAAVASPFTVTMDINPSIAKLDVKTGGSLNDGGLTLTISGALVMNGSWTGSGKISLTTPSDTIYGTGSATGTSTLEIGGSVVVHPTANLSLKAVSILAADTLKNLGAATVTSVTGAAATSSWINAPNSTLNISGAGFTTATLNASSCPNVVAFTGAVAQTVNPVMYCDLLLSNSGLKTFASGTVGVAGALSLAGGATVDAVTNGTTVDYNGTGAQTITALRYTNLVLSGNKGGQIVTLAADTTRILGAFTSTATNFTVGNAGSTFEYAGSAAQTITPFQYFNLLLSGSGAKSLLLSQTTNGDVTVLPGTPLTVDAAATWQIDGMLTPGTAFINDGTINIGN